MPLATGRPLLSAPFHCTMYNRALPVRSPGFEQPYGVLKNHLKGIIHLAI